MLGNFRLEYEYKIDYEYDYSDLEHMSIKIITSYLYSYLKLSIEAGRSMVDELN